MQGKLKITSSKGNVTAQFNPTEFTLDKGVRIKEMETKRLNAAVLEFIRGSNEKLSLTLLFDDTLDNKVGVAAQAATLQEMAKVDKGSGQKAPPVCTVTWSDMSFTGYMESVQRKFTLFDESGAPLRALVSMSFIEFKTEEQLLAEVGGQTSPHTTRRVVKRGDTLNRIAAEVYGDAGAWRYIVETNPGVVSNPRRLDAGTVLILPPLEGP